MNSILKNFGHKIRIAMGYILSLLPIQRKVVFDNYYGKNFGCNPKYIASALLKLDSDVDVVWIVNEYYDDIPKQIRQVKHKSVKEIYEYCTSAVWVDNVTSMYKPRKKKNQFYIQTWHGSIAIKKVELDVAETMSESYRKIINRDHGMTDLMVSNSSFCSDMYRRAFGYQGEIIECGSPRNDCLIEADPHLRFEVRKDLNISEYEYVVLYAPTFRDDGRTDSYISNFRALINAFHNRTGKSIRILLRLHPSMTDLFHFSTTLGSVTDVSDYPDIQELYLVADALVSDYSSTAVEFSLQKRPVFLYIPDVVQYQRERGLYFDMNELPFLKAQTMDELLQLIEMYNYEDYQKEVTLFFRSLGTVENGTAGLQVAKRIIRVLNNG